MVVDALDLCYTKQHLDTFLVILSGDSDFSPLVSKLRENAKNRRWGRREELQLDLFSSITAINFFITTISCAKTRARPPSGPAPDQ